jgi:hypothetical protein
MGTSGVKLVEFYFLTFFLCVNPLQYPPGFLQLITAIVHTKHRQELIPSNIDLSNMQPGYYGEGSVDLCQGPIRRCVISKSPSHSRASVSGIVPYSAPTHSW